MNRSQRGAIPKITTRRRNERKFVLNANFNADKHRNDQPYASTSTNAGLQNDDVLVQPNTLNSNNGRGGHHGQQTAASRVAKNRQNRYQNNGRNINDGHRGRDRTDSPVNRQQNTDRYRGGRGRPLSFQYLQEIMNLDEEEFVLIMSGKINGLNEFVQGINLTDDSYVLIIRILKKIFDSRFISSQHILVHTILKERFVNNLQKYLGSLPMHDEKQKCKNKLFWQNTDEFWTILIEVSRKVLEMIPNYALTILPKVILALQICIPSFEQYQDQRVSDEIKEKLNELDRAFQVAKLRFKDDAESKAVHNDNRKKFIFEGKEPPEDFRTISVYPDVTELLSGRSFVRPNIIDGPYSDVNHYLDIQFRLLREDFVNPLRSGVRCILSGKNKRLENVRVHKKIRFMNQETINDLHCVRLKFNFSQKTLNFSYENSKKFMFGTLLCFTRDKFATMKFARVVKRDIEDLEKGELVVGFDEPESDLMFNHDYLMVECSIYFEPYFYVLTALKNMEENDFAMKEYIVDVQPVNALPSYLNLHTIYRFDFREHSIVDLMNATNNFYGFNDSQMNAFRAALTQKFAIIQGPPGTGKTFVGLKIARTLIRNQVAWWNSTPMLVVCFTNHALDQFLEGLLQTTQSIVRIGGQSKNVNLKHLNLMNLRRTTGDHKSYINKNLVQNTLQELAFVTTDIKNIDQYNGIVSFSHLCHNVPDLKKTFFYTAKPECFIDWLLKGRQESHLRKGEEGKNDNIGRSKNQEHVGDFDPENVFIYDREDDTIHEILDELLLADIDADICAITLENMGREIQTLISKLDSMKSNQEVTIDEELTPELNLLQINDTENDLFELEAQYIYLEKRLKEVRHSIENQLIRTDIDVENLELIHHDERWALYTFWLNNFKQDLQQRAAVLTQEFQGLYKQYEEVQNLEDTRLLRQKLVVGMTTTNAARLRSVVEGLRSPIVIFEEAAEVLEAHIITALTKHCQHLILIGDHKQLKPTSADYEITKDYNLGISLFERMVNNGIQCHSLNVQHRMRPEFSRLICPIIYPDLKDHESVFDRPPIVGITSCIRFINHTHLEDDCGDNPTKKNLYEVKFAVALARHLILNGYKSEQVTILAAYLGQMFEMFKERDRYGSIIKNVRIVALDNYQGEESDIIILSLVRSNKENKIGFLATENRACVALSRAKLGFYIIGNMESLSRKSELWRKIRTILEEQNAIGPDLVLRCEVHTDTITKVNKGPDFEQISEGGCNQICGAKLICNHVCRSLCHVQNREHNNHQCLERCDKKLCDQDEGHICKKMCYEECGPCTYQVRRELNCGHELSLPCYIDPDTYEYPVLVKTKLPCDHIADKPCHISTDTFVCQISCENIIDPCGHACTRKCHINDDPDHIEYKCMKKCARPRVDCTMGTDPVVHLCPRLCYEPCVPCDIQIRKQRTKCSHMHNVACNVDVDSIKCEKPCKRQLSCGHKCKKLCDAPCEPSSCLVKVKKVLKLCGHTVDALCKQEPNRSRCEKKCPLQLPCGHLCTKKCNQECTRICEVLINCNVEAACGHVILQIKCHDWIPGIAKTDKRLLRHCSEPCNVELMCGHQCSGTCGECLQGRFHKRCSEKCGVPLVCNHECGFPCREACRPCEKPCTYRCVHSVCKKKCGEVCIPCKEPCQRRCQHQKCSQPCSSICDVQPCTQPCPKLLHCGHPCIGFCGEPCPLKCLTCDRQELLETEMLFGYEDENSRFVFLSDCKHVLENEGMEKWLKTNDNTSEIGVKNCPKCKTPIKTTLRYSDHIKLAIADVNKVKIKAVGSDIENDVIRQNLMERIRILQSRLQFSIWESNLQKLENRLKPVLKKTRQNIDKIQLTAIASKLQVLEQLVKICKNQENMNLFSQYQKEIHDVLARDVNYITNHEIENVMSELQRLHRAIQYENIKSFPEFANASTNPKAKQLIKDIEIMINRLGPYQDDEKLKSQLDKLNQTLGLQLALSEHERVAIVRAIGMGRGHWFKCPNGHIYVITECGGAMIESRCNECGEKIGGGSLTLLESNSLASEMDGARYAAWSNVANDMRNFMDLVE